MIIKKGYPIQFFCDHCGKEFIGLDYNARSTSDYSDCCALCREKLSIQIWWLIRDYCFKIRINLITIPKYKLKQWIKKRRL